MTTRRVEGYDTREQAYAALDDALQLLRVHGFIRHGWRLRVTRTATGWELRAVKDTS
jgi:hypothetical protein